MSAPSDRTAPVTDECPMGDNAFNGTIHAVTVDIGDDAVAYFESLENIHYNTGTVSTNQEYFP